MCIRGRYAEHADLHAVDEVYIDRVYDLTGLRIGPSLIIDVGAHVGSFTLLAHAIFPEARVLAIEPDPDNFALLNGNLTQNRAHIDTQECALMDYNGSSFLSGPTSMGKRLHGTLGTSVSVRRLQSLVGLSSVESLLLKIDIEGAEWTVLDDVAVDLPRNSVIFVELHGGVSDLERIEQFASRWCFSPEITKVKGAYREATLKRGNFAF